MLPRHTQLPESPWKTALRGWAAVLVRQLIVSGARLLTGVRALWGSGASVNGPSAEQTVYFANHTSHGDFVLLWATLPSDLRTFTRPVAGEDYWDKSSLRRFIGRDVFNALMIRRDAKAVGLDPLAQMGAALTSGDSLIIFPEGTRNIGDEVLLPLKSGIYHLSQSFVDVRFVPVWIENLKRVLPKGALLPVPLACTVRFGEPLALTAQDDKTEFLTRARQALLDLRPEYDREGTGNAVLPLPPPPPSTPALNSVRQPGNGA
jgi:1-acyl-sn-glycerol-3-phosphate acyltransferase